MSDAEIGDSNGLEPDILSWLSAHLFGAPCTPDVPTSLLEWWEHYRAHRVPWRASIDQALAGGVLSDRVGYAFVAGYQAALRALIPSVPDEALASLCITEAGGAHPRAIRTELSPVAPTDVSIASPGHGNGHWRLTGRKQWSTLGCEGDLLFVAASAGIDDRGRNRIRMVRVAGQAPGVRREPMPPTPFVPEVSHAVVHLEAVDVREADLLPGDGYTHYIKPFRTVEDIHVNAALLGHLLWVGHTWRWPRAVLEELLSLAVLVRGLGRADPNAPGTHIALAGFFTLFQRALDALEPCWELVDPLVRERWRRDVVLRLVAEGARATRLERAWGE